MTTSPAYVTKQASADDAAQRCPYAGTAFDPGDELAICSSCGTLHLRASWVENKGCTTYGCENSPDFRKDTPQQEVMSLRIRRLMAEQERLAKAYDSHEQITIRPEPASPPERYEVDLYIKGLECLPSGELVSRDIHTIEIILPAEFPRQPPICKMKTPIFHPNIDQWDICTSDHWAAQETLVDLVVRIGQMITYQSHNTKSPLNADAARWCDENQGRLPVDVVDLHPPDLLMAAEVLRDRLHKASKKQARLQSATTVTAARDAIQAAREALALDVPVDQLECSAMLGERKSILERLDVIDDVVAKIEACSRVRDARRLRADAIASLESVRSDVSTVLHSMSTLAAPPWFKEGTLTPNLLRKLATDTSTLMHAANQALADSEADNCSNLPDSLPTQDVPEELRCLHTALLGSPPIMALECPEALTLKCQNALSQLTEVEGTLNLLRRAFKAFALGARISDSAEELKLALRDHPDSIRITVPPQEIILSAGDEHEIVPETFVRCRLKSSNGCLSLTDRHGHQFAEFHSDNSVELRSLGPTALARPNGLTSRQVHDQCMQLLEAIKASSSLAVTQGTPSFDLPQWWNDWTAPISTDQRDTAMRQLRSLMQDAKHSLLVSRIRTMVLDLIALVRYGQNLVIDLEQMQSKLSQTSTRIEELIKQGKRKRNGTMRLRAELIDEFYSLQSALPSHQEDWNKQVQRLKKCEHSVAAAIEKITSTFGKMHGSEPVPHLSDQVSSACDEAQTNLAHWRSHHDGFTS